MVIISVHVKHIGNAFILDLCWVHLPVKIFTLILCYMLNNGRHCKAMNYFGMNNIIGICYLGMATVVS